MSREPRRCRKARSRPIPFDCKLDAGHAGKCTPYTLRPPTLDEWARMGAPWALARLSAQVTQAAEIARQDYDPNRHYPVYCAFCGCGLYRWYLCLRAPMCAKCHGKEGPMLHPARWELDPARTSAEGFAVWQEWATAAQTAA